MYQDIHVADVILHDEVLAKWLAETYPEIFEIFDNEQLDNKVMEQLVLNAICTELVRLQTQHKDIGKDDKIQLVEYVPSGDSMVIEWNQLITNGNMMTNTDWTATSATRTFSDNTMIITLTSGNASNRRVYQALAESIASGHKIYCKFKYKVNRANYDYRFALNSTTTLPTTTSDSCVVFSVTDSQVDTWMQYRGVLTTTVNSLYFMMGTRLATNVTPVPTITVDDIQLFDLTQMFGMGNELDINEFDAIFNEEYYEYNSGVEQEIVLPPTDIPINTVYFEIQNEEGE